MSTPEKTIDAYLEDIRKKFLEQKVNSSKPLSWGQFLDNQGHGGGQVGLYGTLAAAIAIKTRNANLSTEAKAVEQELISYWNNRTDLSDPSRHDNLCQNVRLAALLLGLSFHSDGNPVTIAEIAGELDSRFSALESLWGDASHPIPNAAHYSEFSSAIVIIFSFQALAHYKGQASDFGSLSSRLTSAANALQKAYLDDCKRARPHLIIMLIAVVLILGKTANSALRDRLTIEISSSENVLLRSWYYVDYLAQSTEYKRDYLILPSQLLVPSLLLQPKIGGGHYLRAVTTIDRIKENLDSNESRLIRAPSDRPSSLEQALAVLALEAFRKNPGRSRLSLLGPRLVIAAKKKRQHEWAFAWFLLIFAYLPLGLAVSAEGLLNTFGPDLPLIFQQLFGAAKLLPSWVPTAVLFAFSAVRQPIEVAKAAVGKSERK